jgi:threonine/homoserine/homoserine lactone efflux protein
MFLYGFIIRLVVENFMAIFISCVLNFMEPNRSTYGEITSMVFAIGLFIAMFVIIFSTTVAMFRKRDNLNED